MGSEMCIRDSKIATQYRHMIMTDKGDNSYKSKPAMKPASSSSGKQTFTTKNKLTSIADNPKQSQTADYC